MMSIEELCRRWARADIGDRTQSSRTRPGGDEFDVARNVDYVLDTRAKARDPDEPSSARAGRSPSTPGTQRRVNSRTNACLYTGIRVSRRGTGGRPPDGVNHR